MSEKLQRFNGGAYAPTEVLRKLRDRFSEEGGKAIPKKNTIRVFWEAYRWYHSPMMPHPAQKERVAHDYKGFRHDGTLPDYVMTAYCRKFGLEHDISKDLPIDFRRV